MGLLHRWQTVQRDSGEEVGILRHYKMSHEHRIQWSPEAQTVTDSLQQTLRIGDS